MEPTNQTNQIEDLIYSAWDEFYLFLSQLDIQRTKQQGINPGSCKNYKDFERIAKKCQARRFDVRDYIKVSLDNSRIPLHVILPKDLNRDAAYDFYADNLKSTAGIGCVADWEWQEKVLLDTVKRSDNANVISVLSKLNNPFYPVFRVCYPDPMDEVLLDVFGLAAWSDISIDPSLYDLLRDIRRDNLTRLEHKFKLG